MQIQSISKAAAQLQTPALVVAIPAVEAGTVVFAETLLADLDKAANGYFTTQGDAGRLPKKAGEVRTFFDVDGIAAASVVVVAVKTTQAGLAALAKTACQYARNYHLDEMTLAVFNQQWKHQDAMLSAKEIAAVLAQQLLHADYRFSGFKAKQPEKPALSVNLLASDADKGVKQGIKQGVAIAGGMNLLRDLGNLPGNVCTPKYLAKRAKKLAKQYDSLSVKVLDKKKIADLGMGSLLSVSCRCPKAPSSRRG